MPDETRRWRSDLSEDEVYWRDYQPWLLSRGYQLRERYQPDWVASWAKPGSKPGIFGEDELRMVMPGLVDAVRLKDGKQVVFKRIKRQDPYIAEKDTAVFFSSDERRNDPVNHCIPIYEVLEPPDDENYVVIVMPLLRKVNSPRFETIGEVVDFFWQAFLGIQFMHRHHVAHRDCCWGNIGMDAAGLYPKGFHPVQQNYDLSYDGDAIPKYTRTQKPPKYYWFDFGLSSRFNENDSSPVALPRRGNDKSVPEFQTPGGMDNLYNPFPTDIYYLGNMIREVFLDGDEGYQVFQPISGLDFMRPLIQEMTRQDPAERPTIDEAVERLRRTISSLSKRKLHSPVRYKDDNRLTWAISLVPYTIRRISCLLNRVHPIPSREGAVKPY